MALVVVMFDVLKVHRILLLGNRHHPRHERMQAGEVRNAPHVALEVHVVHRIKADQRREQTDIRFRHDIVHQPLALLEPLIQPRERLKQRPNSLFVRLLR